MTGNNVMNFSDQQISTIKRTVAPDANAMEFDLFMNAARSYGLDPFRKQISMIIFSKDKPDKRRHAIIVGRDGLRSIAQRCGDYRPASGPAQFVYDEELKGPDNPKGIVSVSVELFKMDKNGDWHPVFGEAYWDEFAPIEEEWAYDEGLGRRAPNGKKKVNQTWAKMSRVMITKCAEAQALRAGWPDIFAGLYAEEEMDQAKAQEMRDVTPADDLTPSQRVAREDHHQRKNMLGDKAIMFVMEPTGIMERIKIGEVADRCLAFFEANDPDEVDAWSIRNREALREFWTESPNDALAVKTAMEKKIAQMQGAQS